MSQDTSRTFISIYPDTSRIFTTIYLTDVDGADSDSTDRQSIEPFSVKQNFTKHSYRSLLHSRSISLWYQPSLVVIDKAKLKVTISEKSAARMQSAVHGRT